jgi:hypothetical protein
MKVNEVYVLEEAVEDLEQGRHFYDSREIGVGGYFWDSLVSDIESLIIYGGIHKRTCGLYQMNAKRFPYSVYYDMIGTAAYVVAVLPMRRDPSWIVGQIGLRR